MGKRYKSVIDLVEDIIDDEEFKEELKKDLQDKSLGHKLYGMRCAAGITQSQMAKKMGCNQSRISKLENAGLDSIKVGDMLCYTKALGLKLKIQFTENEDSDESSLFVIKTPVNEKEEIQDNCKIPVIMPVVIYNWGESTQNKPHFNKRERSLNGTIKRNYAYQGELQ